MMKVLALDLGDVWTGSAISDILGITSRPLKTVHTKDLDAFIEETIKSEPIKTIVIGYPKTLSGTESEQTKKVLAKKEELSKKFSSVQWVLWDERLSSKHAAKLKKSRTKEDKIRSHSIAAASILQTYLAYQATISTPTF